MTKNIKTTVEELHKLINIDNVIGKPIETEDKVLIPVMRMGVGFGAGGNISGNDGTEAVGAGKSQVPSEVGVGGSTNPIGEHDGVSAFLGAINAVAHDLCKVAFDIVDADGVVNDNKQGILTFVFANGSVFGIADVNQWMIIELVIIDVIVVDTTSDQ